LRQKQKAAKRERERERARSPEMADGEDAAAARRRASVTEYRKKLLNCRELESRVSTGEPPAPHPSTSPLLDFRSP
jgi:26S proteasome regulatory subunit T4